VPCTSTGTRVSEEEIVAFARFRSIERWASRPAPLLGQDNARVLREVLGMGNRQIEELTQAGVIGDWPVNV
jgi:crotonobetainyl-CoA:carnitine CoA-transferase CaiB-like acyl-CoA transferase